MSNITLAHPLVRAYLHQLTEALASLPPERAAELRDQIAAHLDEELPPGATDDEVAEAIRRMGTPSDLAREAGARRTIRAALRRRSWRFWTVTGVVIATAGVFIGLFVSVTSAPDLISEGTYGWWYLQDIKHAVDTEAQGYEQLTVQVRRDQQQGYFIELFNFTRSTQTVLGSPGGMIWPDNARVAVSTDANPLDQPPDIPPQLDHYGLPVSIPPGGARFLRVMWTSQHLCVANGAAGTSEIRLRVRVGWMTRTEIIDMPVEFALTGCPKAG